MPDNNGGGTLDTKQQYKNAQQSIRNSIDNVINGYFSDAKKSGELQSQEKAAETIYKRIDSVCAAQATVFHVPDRLDDLQKYGREQAKDKIGSSYRKYFDDFHPQITDKEPTSVSEEESKQLRPHAKEAEGLLADDMNTYLARCAATGTCPNEKQATAFIKGCIKKYVKGYDKKYNFTPDEKKWFQKELENYIPELLTTYHSYADNVVVTNTTPGDYSTLPDGTVVAQDGTVIPPSQQQIPPKPTKPPAPMASVYTRTNVSFSGCDMVVSASMKSTDGHTVSVVMGSVQTVSYSIYRKLSPINNIGNVNAKDYVGGPRTVAGSLVFTVFHQHWATELMDEFYKAEGYAMNRKVLMDEIAPIDLTISMANEYGVKSRLAIYGVRLFSEGQVMSINDIYTENTYQYVALNIDYLANIQVEEDIWGRYLKERAAFNAADQAYKDAMKMQPVMDGGSRTTSSTPDSFGTTTSNDSSESQPETFESNGEQKPGEDLKQEDPKSVIESRIGNEDKESSTDNSRTESNARITAFGHEIDISNMTVVEANRIISQLYNQQIGMLNSTPSINAAQKKSEIERMRAEHDRAIKEVNQMLG